MCQTKGLGYDQLLLSELRLLSYSPSNIEPTDELIRKAVTLNENLISLGYTLRPDDIALISKSKDLDGFFEKFKGLLGEVKALPMYPDFPKTVMEMDEATFRLHQLAHYFSTYGIERLFGVKVKNGWIPDTPSTEKTLEDDRLLEAKVVSLIDEAEKFKEPVKNLLSRKQRLNDKEKILVKLAITDLLPDFLSKIDVPFKQNLLDVFYGIFTAEINSDKKLEYLLAIVKHSGDCFKCIDYALTKCDYHFKTSQKRLLVKLFESFDLYDFENNLFLSAKKAERSNIVLNYLDYNLYSKSSAHKKLVDELRDGKLRSWLSQAEKAITNGDGIEFLKQRPGVLLRYITRLFKYGYSQQDILNALTEKVDELSLPTLVSVLTSKGRLVKYVKKCGYTPVNGVFDILSLFGYERDLSAFLAADGKISRDELCVEYANASLKLYDILYELFKIKALRISTPLKGKKVFLDFSSYDTERSEIQLNERAADGGYLRSGLAYKIPQGVSTIRFFVYWNDPERVDIDLHASALNSKSEPVAIGWNAHFKNSGIIFSGDKTTSNSAEYIDLNLSDLIKEVSFNINIFNGKKSFKEIQTCFVGIMAVSNLGAKIKLYVAKNCFFQHFLTSEASTLNYGYVDVENRSIIFDGKVAKEKYYGRAVHFGNEFSLKKYVDDLLSAQNASLVDDKNSADVVLVMEKPVDDKEISLLDENFFVDC